jgi:hypothetical protein
MTEDRMSVMCGSVDAATLLRQSMEIYDKEFAVRALEFDESLLESSRNAMLCSLQQESTCLIV